MGLPTGEIEAAFITRYRNDTTLVNLLAGRPAVYDEMGVPPDTAFPFITVFTVSSLKGTAFSWSNDSVDTFVQVASYTQTGEDGGFAHARAIMSRIYFLTDQKPLSLANGFRNFFILFDSEQANPQADGFTQQIVHRYSLKTQG